jgi:hypothetical protein
MELRRIESQGDRFSAHYVAFEVITAVVMKVAIFWDIAPCSPYMNQRFEGTYHHHLQSRNRPRKKPGFLLAWFSTLKMGMILSCETLVHILTTKCYIPEDGNFSWSVWSRVKGIDSNSRLNFLMVLLSPQKNSTMLPLLGYDRLLPSPSNSSFIITSEAT